MICWNDLVALATQHAASGDVFGDPTLARLVLAEQLGEQLLRDAVDTYTRGGNGTELARSLLALLAPAASALYCHTLASQSRDVEQRRAAVELLRVVADASALSWIEGYLEDEDSEIQRWGMAVLDALIWRGQVEPADVETILTRGELHPNPRVREQARWSREELARRARHRREPDR
jgi:hypothetical protein